MILKRLVEYWERQPDSVPSGYQRAFLTKKIVLDRQGRLVSIETLSGETRGKRHGKTFAVPREHRAGAIRPRLVNDNPNYALGLPGTDDKPEKVAARHSSYLKLLHACYDRTKEDRLRALLAFLDGSEYKSARVLDSIEELDYLLFEVDGVIPTDLPSLRAFWAERKGGELGRCMVTGGESVIVERMPFPIKGVPGGQSSGTMLISVNNPSGKSYGLEAAKNSPIGAPTAEALCNALNNLLADGKRSLRIGEAVYIYWTRDPSNFDFMSFLGKPDEGEVAALLASPKSGREAGPVDENEFFILGLSANASRIVVRDFHETTLSSIRASLARWFKMLALVGPDGKLARPEGIFRLAISLYRESKDIPKHVPVELMRSAISGTPLPKRILALAARRNTVMQGPYSEFNGKRSLSTARLSLIKAVLISHDTNLEEISLTSLEHHHPDPAYHCGRLLSVLESIQRLAVPGLNATLVDKHYGSACGSPCVSFGGLIKDATTAHLPKLRKSRPGAHHALDQRLQEVLGEIGSSFPKTLDYERQGLFALGYYHQRMDDIAKARAHKEMKELADAETDIADQEEAE